jgi:hypothetical protein
MRRVTPATVVAMDVAVTPTGATVAEGSSATISVAGCRRRGRALRRRNGDATAAVALTTIETGIGDEMLAGVAAEALSVIVEVPAPPEAQPPSAMTVAVTVAATALAHQTDRATTTVVISVGSRRIGATTTVALGEAATKPHDQAVGAAVQEGA